MTREQMIDEAVRNLIRVGSVWRFHIVLMAQDAGNETGRRVRRKWGYVAEAIRAEFRRVVAEQHG